MIGVGENECPICGEKLKVSRFISYSQFGKPARDLSDSPHFSLFSKVRICPWDHYASWTKWWHIENEDEKEKLRQFLEQKPLSLKLTSAEKEIIGDDLTLIKGIKDILWSRECSKLRPPSSRRDWFEAINLFYATQSSTSKSANELHAHYRDQAITSLETAIKEDWPTTKERLLFPYLRAELLRQKGETKKATQAFQAVLKQLKAQEISEDDKDIGWLIHWSKEQTALIKADTQTTEGLSTQVIVPFPDPWNESGAIESLGENYMFHRLALEKLIQRAAQGDTTANNFIWNSLDQDVTRLLALAETLEDIPTESIFEISQKNDNAKNWLSEIRATLKKDQTPVPLDANQNQTRVKNVLSRAVGWDRPMGARFGGPLKKIDTKRKRYKELMEIIEKESPEKAQLAAQEALQMLQEENENGKYVTYPLQYLLKNIWSRKDELKKELQHAYTQDWNSSFWKNIGGYLAEIDGCGDRLSKHKLTKKETESEGKIYEKLLWKLFAEAGDPIWTEKSIKRLTSKDWLIDASREYAEKINSPPLRQALFSRHQWLSSRPKAKEHGQHSIREMFDYEAQAIEEWMRKNRWENIQIQ